MEVACIIKPGAACDIRPRSFFTDRTVQQIAESISVPVNSIFIKTPFVCKRLDSSTLIEKEYPEIFYKERPSTYSRPPYHIRVLTSESVDDLTIYLLPVVSENLEFPPIPVPVTNLSSISQFIERAQEVFAIPSKDPVITPDFDSIDSLIEYSMKENANLHLRVEESDLKSIRMRSYTLAEIISTEKTYLDDLSNLIDYWKPQLSTILTPDELAQVFRELPPVLNCHTQFRDNLVSRGTSASSCVADVFVEFAPFFKFAKNYISHYPGIISILTSKTDKNVTKRLSEISEQNPSGSKRDFQSYMITPIQRMPRYSLFLKSLTKWTHKWHPDSELIGAATEAIERVTLEFEKATSQSQKINELIVIEQRIHKEIKIVHTERQLKYEVSCKLTKPHQAAVSLYLFNDMIMLHEPEKGVLFSEKLKQWKYFPEGKVISFFYRKSKKKLFGKSFKNFEIEFEKTSDFASFIETVENVRMEDQTQDAFTWNNIILDTPVPKISGMQAVWYPVPSHKEGLLYLYGNAFYCIDIDNKTFSPVFSDKTPMSSIGHTLTRVGNLIVMYGGSTNSAIWEFDISMREWKKYEPINLPEARSYHSAIAYKDTVVVYGGLSKRGLLYDVAIWSTSLKKWTMIFDGNSPLPRSNHSAALLNDTMIIFGGKGEEGVFNDLHGFNLTTRVWSRFKVEEGITGRFDAKMEILNGWAVIIGGSSLVKKQLLGIQAVNVFTGKVKFEREEGNCHQSITDFACAKSDSGIIYIVGGGEVGTNNHRGSVFAITPPKVIGENTHVVANYDEDSVTAESTTCSYETLVSASSEKLASRSGFVRIPQQIFEKEPVQPAASIDSFGIFDSRPSEKATLTFTTTSLLTEEPIMTASSQKDIEHIKELVETKTKEVQTEKVEDMTKQVLGNTEKQAATKVEQNQQKTDVQKNTETKVEQHHKAKVVVKQETKETQKLKQPRPESELKQEQKISQVTHRPSDTVGTKQNSRQAPLDQSQQMSKTTQKVAEQKTTVTKKTLPTIKPKKPAPPETASTTDKNASAIDTIIKLYCTKSGVNPEALSMSERSEVAKKIKTINKLQIQAKELQDIVNKAYSKSFEVKDTTYVKIFKENYPTAQIRAVKGDLTVDSLQSVISKVHHTFSYTTIRMKEGVVRLSDATLTAAIREMKARGDNNIVTYVN